MQTEAAQFIITFLEIYFTPIDHEIKALKNDCNSFSHNEFEENISFFCCFNFYVTQFSCSTVQSNRNDFVSIIYSLGH